MVNKQLLYVENKSHKMERFLEVCLLLLLLDDVNYGYGLIEQLEVFGFTSDELNVSTLYRTLRKMENEDLVTSGWEQGNQGPSKRMYRITENGKDNLDHWIKVLEVRKQRIELLMSRYLEKKQLETVGANGII